MVRRTILGSVRLLALPWLREAYGPLPPLEAGALERLCVWWDGNASKHDSQIRSHRRHQGSALVRPRGKPY
eukprot:scaffold141836_cov31-Prasinocladus_malaysianus.AAC.3